MHDIETRLAAIDWEAMEWQYADYDSAARGEMTRRIADAGRRLKLITYSELVRGIQFHLGNVRGGTPFTIDTEEWTGLDRAILGSFLGAISARSYMEAHFLASALVVNKSEFMPSDHFFRWMEELGVLPDMEEDTVLAFWADQVNKAHNWYGRRPPGAA